MKKIFAVLICLILLVSCKNEEIPDNPISFDDVLSEVNGEREALNAENYDFKGFEPDIRCDPKFADEAVINMIKRYELNK